MAKKTTKGIFRRFTQKDSDDTGKKVRGIFRSRTIPKTKRETPPRRKRGNKYA